MPPIDYNPKDASNCWPEDDYSAVLEKVEDKTSKEKPDGSGGKPMQVMTWSIYHSDGRKQLITDYVVIPNALFKIKQLAVALGKRDQFDDGQFQADDNIGCSVIAHLVIEESEGFDDKNKIGRIKAKNAPAKPAGVREKVLARTGAAPDLTQEQFKDDDIPF